MARRLRASIVTVALSLTLLATGVLPAQADPVVVGADAFSEVRPEGARVVAVAVEFSEELPADVVVPVEQLSVVVGDEPRTVLSAHTASAPDAVETGEPGRYLRIKLDPADENAEALVPEDLIGQYTVALTADITDDGGTVVVAPFEVANRAVHTAVVDEFDEGSFTGSTGATLNYRLFVPPEVGTDDDGLPLVVFLHGGGEVGQDNVTQLTANQGAVAFAAPSWQEGQPALVLAPQLPLPEDTQWEMPEIQVALAELIDDVTARAAVDDDRLYLTGLSRGARGALQLLPTSPNRFAGVLLAAGRASQTGETEHVAALAGLPLWATHAVDDDVVDYTTGTAAFMATLEDAGAVVTRATWSASLDAEAAEAAAGAQWAEAEAQGSSTLFTTFAVGTTPVGSHHSWIPTFGNDVMLEWLFSQVRPAEPAPEPTTPEPTAAPEPTTTPEPTVTSEPTTMLPAATVPPAGGAEGRLPATGSPTLAAASLTFLLVVAGCAVRTARRRLVRAG